MLGIETDQVRFYSFVVTVGAWVFVLYYTLKIQNAALRLQQLAIEEVNRSHAMAIAFGIRMRRRGLEEVKEFYQDQPTAGRWDTEGYIDLRIMELKREEEATMEALKRGGWGHAAPPDQK